MDYYIPRTCKDLLVFSRRYQKPDFVKVCYIQIRFGGAKFDYLATYEDMYKGDLISWEHIYDKQQCPPKQVMNKVDLKKRKKTGRFECVTV